MNEHGHSSPHTSGWDWHALRSAAVRECRHILGNAHDAEDAAQQALIRAWRFAASCRTPERPEPWIRTISRREALRWHGRRGDVAVDAESLDQAAAPAGEFAASAELRADVAAALRGLDERDRRLLLMQYWQESSCAETAAALGMPVGTVKIRLHRSRRRLAGVLGAGPEPALAGQPSASRGA